MSTAAPVRCDARPGDEHRPQGILNICVAVKLVGRGVPAESRLTEDGDECDSLGGSPYPEISGYGISENTGEA